MDGAFGARGCASAAIEVEFESTNGSVKTTANQVCFHSLGLGPGRLNRTYVTRHQKPARLLGDISTLVVGKTLTLLSHRAEKGNGGVSFLSSLWPISCYSDAPVSGGGFTVFQKSTMKRRSCNVVATPTTTSATTTADSLCVGETVDKDGLHLRDAKQSWTEQGKVKITKTFIQIKSFFFFFF